MAQDDGRVVPLLLALFLGLCIASVWSLSGELPAPPTPPLRVACVGDQFTRGDGASARRHTYPSQLKARTGARVRNLGVDNVTVLQYLISDACEVLEDEAFDVVIIMLGTNDARSAALDEDLFLDRYGDLIALVRPAMVYAVVPPLQTRITAEALAHTGADVVVVPTHPIVPTDAGYADLARALAWQMMGST